jgi:hypothetical protein
MRRELDLQKEYERHGRLRAWYYERVGVRESPFEESHPSAKTRCQLETKRSSAYLAKGSDAEVLSQYKLAYLDRRLLHGEIYIYSSVYKAIKPVEMWTISKARR